MAEPLPFGIQRVPDVGISRHGHFQGSSLHCGEGVAKDETEMAKWFRKAADQGFVNAQYDSGVCYQSGLGVTNDYV